MSDSMVRHRGIITVICIAATVMQGIDTTIANIALPHMQGSLSAAQDQIAWVLTSYLVAGAIVTPMSGWLASRFGRKRMLFIAIAGFTGASMLCGASTSLVQIVLFRLLQGAFGAPLMPMSQSLLLDSTPPEKVGVAMGIWTAGSMVAPILGPTLGGWITDHYEWRWVFYINLPIGILCGLGVLFFVSETRINRKQPFDFFGFAFLSLAIGAFQMMIDRGERNDWFSSTEIVVEAALVAGGFWVFLVHSATAARPFFSSALLKDRNLVASIIFVFMTVALIYASMALLPPMLTMLGYPEVAIGFLLGPRGFATMAASITAGRLIGRIGPRPLMAVGFFLEALSFWQMAGFSPLMGSWPVTVSIFVQGAGIACLFTPAAATAFSTVPLELRTEASGLFNLSRNMGSSIGISVAETMLDRMTQASHSDLVQNITPWNPALQQPGISDYWSLDSVTGLSALDQTINLQAAMIGYIDIFKFMMVAVILLSPLVFIIRPIKRGTAAPADLAVE